MTKKNRLIATTRLANNHRGLQLKRASGQREDGHSVRH
jgi:hypothetical protein